VEVDHHGEILVDEYAWMKERTPELRAHLTAENAHAEARTAHLADLRRDLYDTLVRRMVEDDQSVPAPRGAWLWSTRLRAGAAYALHVRSPRSGGDEVVLLDENARAAGQPFYHLGDFRPNPGATWAAFTEDTAGDERYALRFVDLSTGAVADEVVHGVKPGLAWLDDHTVLYTVADEVDRPWQVRRHRLGGAPGDDAIVYEDPDKAFYVSVRRTLDGAFAVIASEAKVTGEVWLLPTDPSQGPLRCVWPRRPGVEVEIDHRGGDLFALTNLDAPNFRLLRRRADGDGPWTEALAERADATPEGLLLLRDHTIVFERADGLPQVRVLSVWGAPWTLRWPDPTWALSREPNLEADTHLLRVGYSAPTTPPTTWEVDLRTGERRALKVLPVRDVDLTRYRCSRTTVRAHDGAEIPVSLLTAADAGPSRPTVLFGYGSYGISHDMGFSLARLSLVDGGAHVAIAHVRGGGECGRAWYHSGRLATKQNTFDDFAAVASWARRSGLASALVASGGSAGGLLMGVMANEHPALFDGILARVPFVDALHTMRDATLPLTVTEYDEWGNPLEPDAGATLRRYAPYDNVRTQRMPPILATAGWNDPRVGVWEPAKWVARLRDRCTGGPFLLRVHLDAGHGGASGRYAALADTAWEYAWVLDQLSDAAVSGQRPAAVSNAAADRADG
jgi:oligopeptidase B